MEGHCFGGSHISLIILAEEEEEEEEDDDDDLHVQSEADQKYLFHSKEKMDFTQISFPSCPHNKHLVRQVGLRGL